MIVPAFEYTLKDGRTAVLRSPEAGDVPAMLDFLRQVTGETHFLLRYPEECSKYTPEGEKALFERLAASGCETMLTCFLDGKVIANSQIQWDPGIKLGHRASVAISVLREFWRQGIGTRIFQELIRIAEDNPRILQMELDFIEGNTRARALYEKMGFRITGVKPNAVRLRDGTLLNEYYMVRPVRR